ncbi:MAG: hypothetical protein ACRDNF_17225 [Streptosporangiaceae bacterium]
MTVPSPLQDPERQAPTRAGLRTLMSVRNAGGVIVFAVMAVLGVVGLATGHERSGIIALVIGAPALIFVVARLTGRR